MWGCGFIQLFSCCKHDEQYPALETERMKAQQLHDKLLNQVWRRIGTNLSGLAPREWPRLSFLSEEEQQRLLDLHPTVAPLKDISD